MKKRFIASGISGALFLVLIALLRTVNVAAIGPAGTKIGLSGINSAVHDFFGMNTVFDKVNDIFLVLSILAGSVFALVALIQLIKRKSLFKVDKELLLLGALYIAMIGVYVLFEGIVINYRPVIMPDELAPEASFPSSHTVCIFVIMSSIFIIAKKYIRIPWLQTVVKALCAGVAVTSVIFRLVAGVHWFTDVLGAVLISLTLVFLYAGFLKLVEGNTKDKNI